MGASGADAGFEGATAPCSGAAEAGVSVGFTGFPVFSFWIALYFQRVLQLSALMTGVYMLPMAICGFLANVVAALIQHKVSNKLLVGIGALAHVVAYLLAAVQKDGMIYWALSFPALSLCVVGVDFEFIVTNVSTSTSSRLPMQVKKYHVLTQADVRSILDASG